MRPLPEDRRRQIMEAAFPLFAEKGFKGTTNRDIAEAAGIAPGLIYWYFKSKEDLFNAILDEFMPTSSMSEALATMIEDPPEVVLPLLLQGIATVMNETRVFDIGRLFISESLRSPAAGLRMNLVVKRLIDSLADYLRAQSARGHLRAEDPLLMAQMLLSSIAIFFIRRRVGLDETLLQYDIATAVSFTIDAFLRAFAP